MRKQRETETCRSFFLARQVRARDASQRNQIFKGRFDERRSDPYIDRRDFFSFLLQKKS